jgi:hypothetical protein
MRSESDYKLDKCLEKLHELHIMVTELKQLDKRMELAESKITALETKVFRLVIAMIVGFSGGSAFVGPEIFKILRSIV